jgi:hypothetical protein
VVGNLELTPVWPGSPQAPTAHAPVFPAAAHTEKGDDWNAGSASKEGNGEKSKGE